jgi:hypothetical protein
VQGSLTFDRALAVAVAPQGQTLSGDEAFRFASTAEPVFAIELDGNAPLAQLGVHLGDTITHLPGTGDSPSIDVDLAGLTAHLMDDGEGTLTVQQLSLGDKTTTLQRGGATAYAIDLNPNDGRTLDATLTFDALRSTETLAVSPRLDLQQWFDHSALGDQPPVYDITRVQLDGSLQAAAGAARVLGGTFAFTTSPTRYGFSAITGQCVTDTDTYDATLDQTYRQFSVAACPSP